jgi:hypothetical protein
VTTTLLKRQSWLRAVPLDEFIDGVSVPAFGFR